MSGATSALRRCARESDLQILCDAEEEEGEMFVVARKRMEQLNLQARRNAMVVMGKKQTSPPR